MEIFGYAAAVILSIVVAVIGIEVVRMLRNAVPRTVKREVRCPRSGKTALCEMERDDLRGVWIDVKTCSELDERGALFCDAPCLDDLNSFEWKFLGRPRQTAA